MQLNEKQLSAVKITKGPLLILAGAGAGKTKTIVERILSLIRQGVEPNNILAVTFTNKAAQEMLNRVLDRMSEEGLLEDYEKNIWTNKNLPTIKTFHSLGLSILRQYGSSLGFGRDLTVLDPGDTNKILKEILLNLGLDPKIHDATKIKNIISLEKSANQSPDDYAKKVANYTMETVEKVWRKYEMILKERHLVDFSDLIILPTKLLKANPEIHNYYHQKFKYIHIDEYQDTNTSQYALIKILLNKQENLCVVGDVDQNIYSWRGANLKNILNFERDFPNGQTVILEENYRSSQNILDLANNLIKKNKARFPKNLFTQQSSGESIEICPAYNEQSEADFVTKKIAELKREKNINLQEVAVLYRTNFQSRILEDAFLKQNLPYILLGTKFFERREVKDVLSYLRFSQNRHNLEDFKRVLETPKRGFGKVSILKIFSGEANSLTGSIKNRLQETYTFLDKIQTQIELSIQPLSSILAMIIEDSGITKELLEGSSEDRERLENIRELVSLTTKFDNLPASQAYEIFLDETALKSDQDDDEKAKSGVRLMTVHASKGLEFDYVFIVGLEEDLFPHADLSNKKKSLEEEEEERRLFYVAVTRARKKLFLCYAEVRTIYGEKRVNLPSIFLEDANDLEDNQVIYNDLYFNQENSFRENSGVGGDDYIDLLDF